MYMNLEKVDNRHGRCIGNWNGKVAQVRRPEFDFWVGEIADSAHGSQIEVGSSPSYLSSTPSHLDRHRLCLELEDTIVGKIVKTTQLTSISL